MLDPREDECYLEVPRGLIGRIALFCFWACFSGVLLGVVAGVILVLFAPFVLNPS